MVLVVAVVVVNVACIGRLTRARMTRWVQALKLVSPDTFSQAAKADRKAIALEKELERMKKTHALNAMHWLVKMPRLMRMVLFVGLIFVVVMSPKGEFGSRRVVAYLDPGMVWPLGRWLSVLSGYGKDAGAVGTIPWAVFCHRVSKYVLGVR